MAGTEQLFQLLSLQQWKKLETVQAAEQKRAVRQMQDFVDGRKNKRSGEEVEKDTLYEEIGRLKVELDWLKKKVGLLD